MRTAEANARRLCGKAETQRAHVAIKSELSCPEVTAGGAPDTFNTDD